MKPAEVLPDLEPELATTRSVLAAVPEARAAWRPHPKSWTLGELAAHVANLVGWLPAILRTERVDVAAPTPEPGTPSLAAQLSAPYAGASELLRRFDAHAASARAALASAAEPDLAVVWTLHAGERTIVALPRALALRTFALNHVIHHRGQLTVYLRLCDVPLPRVYGPTADSR